MTPQEKEHYTKLGEHYNSDRDCPTCIHHTEKGCSAWNCEYEKRMSVEEAIMQLDWRKDFATPSQITALDMAIRSLEAWNMVKDRISHGGDFVFEDKNAFYSDSVIALIDKALGEVGEKE